MFKITIEKIETKTITEKGKWCKTGDRPYTKKECEDAGFGNNFEAELKPIYSYLPDVKVEKEVIIKVLEQSIEEIDLVEVIKAINNIKG